MDIFWFILGILIMLVGLVGCVIPLLPGPPLGYVGLLVQQLRSDAPFSLRFLLIWACITIVITVLDYVVPLYGMKKFGGTKYGVWGCSLGLFVGLFFAPWGIVLGPFMGALIGEIIAGSNSNKAMKAAIGSFVGFLFGTLVKLVVCAMMLYYLIVSF